MISKQKHAGTENQPGFILSRRAFLVAGSSAVIGAALPLGCGNSKESSGRGAVDSAAKGTPWEGTIKVADLSTSLHLADLTHFGEFVDFGTAARFKYTLGGWMSGWDNDTSMNGIAYTWATASPGRLYFSVDQAGPLKFGLRVKKGGSDYFSVYLNDKPLSKIVFKGNDWEDHVIDAPAETVLAGENAFKLVYATAEKKGGGGLPASFAVDYLRIIPEGALEAAGTKFDAPYLQGLRQSFKSKDDQRDAVVLPAPSSLRYYVEVPSSGCLAFAAVAAENISNPAASQAVIKVELTRAEGGAAELLLDKPVTTAAFTAYSVDLSSHAGQVVRLELRVEGPVGARVALSDLALRAAPPARMEAASRKAKNAIVLLIDTQRADKLSTYGKTRVKSPVFDKVATEATVFERCQSVSNWTKPACASVLTGQYPDTHKTRGHSSVLGKSVKMASDIFQGAGFATAAFIANGYLASEFGFNRGWNQYVNFIRENKNSEAESVFKTALEFITANKDKPFFTYIQTIDPHVPYDPPEEDLKLYDAAPYDGPVANRSTGNLLEDIKRGRVKMEGRDKQRLEALYDGEVTYHDRHLGHFLDALAKLGVLDDTVIVITADHGEEFFEHESVGHGHTLYQELIHVPLAIRAPGIVPAGRRIADPTSVTDVLPTVLEATGVEVPKHVEGRSLLESARGILPNPFNASFSAFFSEADDRNLQWSAVKGDFKLRMKGPASTYLHQLANDPGEKEDVDTRYPIALRALRILHGQFVGAPDKAAWLSDQISAQVVGGNKAQEEKAEVPDDLKAQLKALGYMQ